MPPPQLLPASFLVDHHVHTNESFSELATRTSGNGTEVDIDCCVLFKNGERVTIFQHSFLQSRIEPLDNVEDYLIVGVVTVAAKDKE